MVRIIPEGVQVFFTRTEKLQAQIAQYRGLKERVHDYDDFYDDRIAVRTRRLEKRGVKVEEDEAA